MVCALVGELEPHTTEFELGVSHVSICLPGSSDLRLLCDIAARALPELDPLSGRTSPATLLHIRAPLRLAAALAPTAPAVGDALYGATLRWLQGEEEDLVTPPADARERPPLITPEHAVSTAPEEAPPAMAPAPPAKGQRSPWDRRLGAEHDDGGHGLWQRAAKQDPSER